MGRGTDGGTRDDWWTDPGVSDRESWSEPGAGGRDLPNDDTGVVLGVVQLGVSVLELARPDPSRCFLCPPLVLALNTGTTGGATDPGLELGPVTVLLDFLARNFGIILGSWLLLELTVWDGPSWRLLILHDVCDVAGS